MQQIQENAHEGAHVDTSDVLIEAPHGYGMRLLLRPGPALEQADGLVYDQRAGVSPAMHQWANALGGLALFPLCGEQGALLVQASYGEGERSAPAVFRVIQDARIDIQPWCDSSEPGWRLLRPPERVQLGGPTACEIIGATFVAGQRVAADEIFVLRARPCRSSGANWRVEWGHESNSMTRACRSA